MCKLSPDEEAAARFVRSVGGEDGETAAQCVADQLTMSLSTMARGANRAPQVTPCRSRSSRWLCQCEEALASSDS